KTLRQHSPEPRAEFFTRQASCRARGIGAHQLQPSRLAPPEPLLLQNHSTGRAFRPARNPPYQVAFLRPQMNHRRLPRNPQFVSEAGEFRQPLPILVQLDVARGKQPFERPLESRPFAHGHNERYSSIGVNSTRWISRPRYS